MADYTTYNQRLSVAGTQNKYTTVLTTYPQDLFDAGNADKYGKSWMMININVQQNSKSVKTEDTIELDPAEQTKAGYAQTEARSRNQGTGAATASQVAGGAVVGGAGKFTLNKFLSGGSRTNALKDVATGAGTGALVGAVASAPILIAGTATRATKRLAQAIQLPMPNAFQCSYQADWSTDNTLIYDLMMRLGQTGMDMFSGGPPSGASQFAQDAMAATALGLAKLPNVEGISAATGMAANMKKEMIFQGVGFRQFSIEYLFYPRSRSEAENIRDIVKLLKYHMHPEYFSENRFTFIYPSEFDITFYTGYGTENEWVTRISTCVLTDLAVNYTPDGQWVTHDDGVPTATRVVMTFKELGIQTKESIDQGF